MSDDPVVSSYLFWKLSILIATLDRIHELLDRKKKDIELNVNDKVYLDSAKLILKSTEVSLNSIREIIESLRTPSAKKYFFRLYSNAIRKLDLILGEISKKNNN